MSGGLQGQSVAVIGGTSGIGAAIADIAAAEGAQVTRAGRAAIDILSDASVRGFFASLGAVDHLVVTAATVRPRPFRDGTTADARATLDGKFWGAFLCARHAEVRQSILLFSGIFSRRPAPGYAALSCANAAVEALGRALAVELAPLRVNVVSPGLVRGTEAYAGMPAPAREAMFAAAAGRLPAGIVGDASSVAGPAVALLKSPYASGIVLDIDGGGMVA
jgi:NAD(P)-dependent dehydrogenase (short-subunit alcohol dehydrogenase family)